MADLYLPQIPQSYMFVDRNGNPVELRMTQEWQEFFRGIFERIGREQNITLRDTEGLLFAAPNNISYDLLKRLEYLEILSQANTFNLNIPNPLYLPGHLIIKRSDFPQIKAIESGGGYTTFGSNSSGQFQINNDSGCGLTIKEFLVGGLFAIPEIEFDSPILGAIGAIRATLNILGSSGGNISTIVLQDNAGGNPSNLTKNASHELVIYSTNEIKIQPNADSNDYIIIQTVSNVPQIITSGSCNLRIAPDTDILELGDGSAGADFVIQINGETNNITFKFYEDEKVFDIDGGLSSAPDEITATDAGVAASLQTINTEVTTNGDADLDNVTLANGISGQEKCIYCVALGNAGDTWKITPANMVGGTQITFSGAGEGCTLKYADNEGWVVVGNNGGTIS